MPTGGNPNGVFLNAPMYSDPKPAGSEFHSIKEDFAIWDGSEWDDGQIVILLSNEANPFEGVDTMFSRWAYTKPFWSDSIAYLMTERGGTYTWDNVHMGGYISGTATQTTTANNGSAIHADSLFYIPVLAPQAIDSIVTWGKVEKSVKNYGLFDVGTDSRTPSGASKTPLHDKLGTLLTIGEDSSIAVTSGNNQSAYVGYAVANPYVVTVTDNYGFAVPNVSVTFSIYSVPTDAVGYSITTTTTTTNSSGQASTILTMGDKTGSYVVRATANLTESPLSFTSTATAIPTPGRRVPFRR